MELSTLIGIVVIFVCIIIGIFLVGGNMGAFLDPGSFMIVVAPIVAGLLASYSFADFFSFPKLLGVAFKKNVLNPIDAINTIVSLATIARKEGMLALDEKTSQLEDAFLKKGIMLVVDGTDPELVKSIMEAEIVSVEGRHIKGQGMMDYICTAGPAYGMIGTILGLIVMLGNLDDPSALGPGMALALITTLYGSIIANAFATPIKTKLQTASGHEILQREIMLEGLLSIQAGENPRIIEEKLYSFLPRSARESAASPVGQED
ncbi:MAG: motility protein A [Oscillospiraceae bacterium]|nr:motility protein A [Oscillospiraceae bacterium]